MHKSDPSAAPPALLLLPGLACDAALWQPQWAALQAARAVRGAPPPVVVDVHARADSLPAMAALLLAEHPGDLLLAGCSLGGMLALQAALLAPQRVRALAVLGSGARADSPATTALRTQAIGEFQAGRMVPLLRANAMFAFHPAHAARLTADYLAMVQRAGAEALVRQNRAVMARADLRPHLAGIACPTWVLHGEDDQVAPPDLGREIAAAIPGARWHGLAHCGHMPTWEQPEAVTGLLTRWLAEADPPTIARPPPP